MPAAKGSARTPLGPIYFYFLSPLAPIVPFLPNSVCIFFDKLKVIISAWNGEIWLAQFYNSSGVSQGWILVWAECKRQRNEVASKLGIIAKLSSSSAPAQLQLRSSSAPA